MASVLETAIARARSGQLTMQSALWTFAASRLSVPERIRERRSQTFSPCCSRKTTTR